MISAFFFGAGAAILAFSTSLLLICGALDLIDNRMRCGMSTHAKDVSVTFALIASAGIALMVGAVVARHFP